MVAGGRKLFADLTEWDARVGASYFYTDGSIVSSRDERFEWRKVGVPCVGSDTIFCFREANMPRIAHRFAVFVFAYAIHVGRQEEYIRIC